MPAGSRSRNNPDWLPTASSSRHTLTGHRDAVNAVAFHPVYSAMATASDDATLKVWDWESGELERTLKGHTKRVTDAEYDSKGKRLGTPSLHLSRLCAITLRVVQSPRLTTSSSSYGTSRTTTRTLRRCAVTNIQYLRHVSCLEMIRS